MTFYSTKLFQIDLMFLHIIKPSFQRISPKVLSQFHSFLTKYHFFPFGIGLFSLSFFLFCFCFESLLYCFRVSHSYLSCRVILQSYFHALRLVTLITVHYKHMCFEDFSYFRVLLPCLVICHLSLNKDPGGVKSMTTCPLPGNIALCDCQFLHLVKFL